MHGVIVIHPDEELGYAYRPNPVDPPRDTCKSVQPSFDYSFLKMICVFKICLVLSCVLAYAIICMR